MKIAFILSHPYQYEYYKELAKKLDNPLFVIERRPKTPFVFSGEFLNQLPGNIVEINSSKLLTIDGLVDIVICMTPVHVLSLFKKSKVVALQYSLAKETYQYGPWRLVADLNLMHGAYSHGKISDVYQSEIVGNPRYDQSFPSQRGGQGILYMPTYGDLSSLSKFVLGLEHFPADIQIKVKLHHASEFADNLEIQKLKADKRVEIVDGYQDGLEVIALADVVISDYSGAMFDALYLDRPIVLFQPPIEQEQQRTTSESLEIAEAASMGPVVTEVADLYEATQAALMSPEQWVDSRANLRSKIFAYQGGASDRIIEVLNRLHGGDYIRSDVKSELRNAYIRYIERNRSLKKGPVSKRVHSGRDSKIVRYVNILEKFWNAIIRKKMR